MTYQGRKAQEPAEKSGLHKRVIDHYLMSNSQEASVSKAVKIAQPWTKQAGIHADTGWNTNEYRLEYIRIPAGMQTDTGWNTRGYRLECKRIPAGMQTDTGWN